MANMKLIYLFLILATSAISQDVPFACNLKVFQTEERRQHANLTHEIMAAVTNRRELPSGFAFQIDSSRVSMIELAEWAAQEKKCCPFFNFQIGVDGPGEGKLTLALSGPEGVKAFIKSEFQLR
jgi:hypothetical protein